ncbi:hypothetical protein V3C99_016704 [Haemonchus contortus]|uniref:Ovule protein n=1 Tax=Haemonchus contortus TaxID=6289 RepID=A0A7I5ECZ0_HAECO
MPRNMHNRILPNRIPFEFFLSDCACWCLLGRSSIYRRILKSLYVFWCYNFYASLLRKSELH